MSPSSTAPCTVTRSSANARTGAVLFVVAATLWFLAIAGPALLELFDQSQCHIAQEIALVKFIEKDRVDAL